MNQSPATAWLIKTFKTITLGEFELTILHEKTSSLPNIDENDAFLIVDKDENAIAFARVYRIRSTMKQTTFYFDIMEKIETEDTLATFKITPMPIAGRAYFSKRKDTIWAVTVVPIFAPAIILIDCFKFNKPALTSPITITLVALLL